MLLRDHRAARSAAVDVVGRAAARRLHATISEWYSVSDEASEIGRSTSAHMADHELREVCVAQPGTRRPSPPGRFDPGRGAPGRVTTSDTRPGA